MFNGQSQKSWDNSVNQQVHTWGVAQNAGGDIVNNFWSSTIDKDLWIIKEIFDYAETKSSISQKDMPDPNDSKITELKTKLSLNFEEDQSKEVAKLIQRCWWKMELVEEFAQKMSEINRWRIDSLILLIQHLFKEKRVCTISNEVVQTAGILEAISNELIPTGKEKNPDYFANALAIVLYFFQMCEIGKKTQKETETDITFLDKCF